VSPNLVEKQRGVGILLVLESGRDHELADLEPVRKLERTGMAARDRSASFLTERKAMQPHAGGWWWRGANSNIMPHDRGIRRAQALRGDPNRFTINESRLCKSAAHRERAALQWLSFSSRLRVRMIRPSVRELFHAKFTSTHDRGCGQGAKAHRSTDHPAPAFDENSISPNAVHAADPLTETDLSEPAPLDQRQAGGVLGKDRPLEHPDARPL